ncbi:MAG TPA: long-chain-fatty-acid--CoA ligase [Gammaproteobacteria bacterium]|jgi:long-chain acyl-CoA synthetase|nr:long-chain-fatty-acid--CoA ligase [Gammaproteobacteria bacterium]
MVDKPWLQSYPDTIRAEIDYRQYNSVAAFFSHSAKTYAERPAFTNMGKTLTFSEIDQLSDQFARWLQHSAKLNKGDRIAIMMPNLLQFPIVLFGALRAGLIVVNTNPLYTDRELKHQLKDSGARAIVIVEAFAHTLADVIEDTGVETVVTTRFGDMLGLLKGSLVNFVVRHVKKMVPPFSLPQAVSLKSVLETGATLPALQDPGIEIEDVAFLQYTGGTTGLAKGAMLTNANLLANTAQAKEWISMVDLKPGHEVIVTALPLYHIFALTANCLTFVMLGAENVLITNPRDLPQFIKTLKGCKMSVITGVNTLFNALLNTPGIETVDFSHLKVTLGGGMAVQRAVADKWQQVTGSTLVEAYGLTEASPAVCINPLDLKEYNGAIGLPISSTECAIKDEAGNDLPTGERGELCVRGPQVMKGYWKREDATAEAIDSDGWLHTGDVAIMDENGFVRIVDRLKDMILVSGFNVYPNEIEDVLAMHPGVLEVGAIGVPDEHSGEVVKVVLVRSDPNLTEEDVRAHCKENLTGYKRPKIIQFVDELPKTTVGKILRRELRDS